MSITSEAASAIEQILQNLATGRGKNISPPLFGLASMTRAEIERMHLALEELPKSVSRLPLPKRLMVPEIEDLNRAALGDLSVIIDALASTGSTSSDIYHAISAKEQHLAAIREAGISRIALEAQIIASKFRIKKAPVFTLRSSLGLRLDDVDTGAEVPVRLLRTPFDCCYVEFTPSEERDSCRKVMYADGEENIVEGAYCLSYENVSIKLMSAAALESLSLDRNKPARVVEICFTGSPLPPQSSTRPSKPVFHDMVELISLVIQDEEETLNDAIERHVAFQFNTRTLSDSNSNRGAGVSEAFKASIRSNLHHLVKALIYLNSDMKVQVEQNEHSDLAERMRNVSSAKKLGKFSQQLKRSYDRILLGPSKKYVPLADTLDKIHSITGVRPHVRRGYFGMRWVGVGRQSAKSTWVKPAFINANNQSGIEHLIEDYLVF